MTRAVAIRRTSSVFGSQSLSGLRKGAAANADEQMMTQRKMPVFTTKMDKQDLNLLVIVAIQFRLNRTGA